jgi:hypothetical protein
MKVFLEHPEENRENRKKFFDEQKIDTSRVVGAEIVHRAKVVIVSDTSQSTISGADALITGEKNLFLSVTVADCLPIFFYDPVAKIIGIAHVGWRGMLLDIIDKTVDTLKKCGSRRENIYVEIGPCIQKDHFEIQKKDEHLFSMYRECVLYRENKVFVDLPRIARIQLKRKGLVPSHIVQSSLCTFCETDTFFSFRRDKPEKIEAMVAVIGMKS